jgi:hypothetical protein
MATGILESGRLMVGIIKLTAHGQLHLASLPHVFAAKKANRLFLKQAFLATAIPKMRRLKTVALQNNCPTNSCQCASINTGQA